MIRAGNGNGRTIRITAGLALVALCAVAATSEAAKKRPAKAAANPTTTPAAPAPTGPKPEMKRLAVLEFRGNAFAPDLMAGLAEHAREGALQVKGRTYEVLSRDAMAAKFKEACGGENCELAALNAQTARKLGGHWLVTGDVVAGEGGSYVATITLHDGTTGEAMVAQGIQSPAQLGIIAGVRPATQALVQQARGRGSGDVATPFDEPKKAKSKAKKKR